MLGNEIIVSITESERILYPELLDTSGFDTLAVRSIMNLQREQSTGIENENDSVIDAIDTLHFLRDTELDEERTPLLSGITAGSMPDAKFSEFLRSIPRIGIERIMTKADVDGSHFEVFSFPFGFSDKGKVTARVIRTVLPDQAGASTVNYSLTRGTKADLKSA